MNRYNARTGLPDPIATKIYKTGQTRGASKSEIYQNRVLRNNTVLIPYRVLGLYRPLAERDFESGYIVLARPEEFFSVEPPLPRDDFADDLTLGSDLLVFYRTRDEWRRFNPNALGWEHAASRTAPLGGQYVARVPDTTNTEDEEIRRGFTGPASGGRGAGIRVYEYASERTIIRTRYQLAYLAWRSEGIFELAQEEGIEDPEQYKNHVDDYCDQHDLGDVERLERHQLLKDGNTVCPLCSVRISAAELASHVEQAEGREVPDLTITSANMFHFEALRPGEFNHCEYNLGWGHHHCNVVDADNGVEATLAWMERTLENNGYRVESPDQSTP